MYENVNTACLYARYSSLHQTEQSIEGQVRVCREFCARNNIIVKDVYIDRATSASKNIEKRVSFLNMIKDSEKHPWDAVVVYKLDRFSRSRYDSATYKYKLKRSGVQLISATENITDSPEGIILESVLEGMAEFYSAELSQKIRRGMRESAYKNAVVGGTIPLGYKIVNKKYVIDEDTAPIVREAFQMFADGVLVKDIVDKFNEKGYQPSRGTKFTRNSFSKMFRNEKYIGVYKYRDYRAENAVPAIISKDIFDIAQQRIKTLAKKPNASGKAKVYYMLSGKLFCGNCGAKMYADSNSRGYRGYICSNKKMNKTCNKKNIRQDIIEDIVTKDAVNLLTDENISTLADMALTAQDNIVQNETGIPALTERLEKTTRSIRNLTKAIENDDEPPESILERLKELEKQKSALKKELTQEQRTVTQLTKPLIMDWLKLFKNGDIEDKEFCRMIVDLFVNSVTAEDKENGYCEITIAYNLTSLPTKTYKLPRFAEGENQSDTTANGRPQQPYPTPNVFTHTLLIRL